MNRMNIIYLDGVAVHLTPEHIDNNKGEECV